MTTLASKFPIFYRRRPLTPLERLTDEQLLTTLVGANILIKKPGETQAVVYNGRFVGRNGFVATDAKEIFILPRKESEKEVLDDILAAFAADEKTIYILPDATFGSVIASWPSLPTKKVIHITQSRVILPKDTPKALTPADREPYLITIDAASFPTVNTQSIFNDILPFIEASITLADFTTASTNNLPLTWLQGLPRTKRVLTIFKTYNVKLKR